MHPNKRKIISSTLKVKANGGIILIYSAVTTTCQCVQGVTNSFTVEGYKEVCVT